MLPLQRRMVRRASAVLAVHVLLVPTSALAGGDISLVGEAFVVSRANSLAAPDVAILSDGSVVVVWENYSFEADQESNVRGRVFYSDGEPVGSAFAVPSSQSGWQEAPSVAAGSDGRFLVAWSGESAPDLWGSSARIFLGNGSPSGPAFPLDEPAPGHSPSRDVSAARDGDGYAIVWTREGSVQGSIAGARLTASGSNRGSFSRFVGALQQVAVDGLPGGRLAIVWSTSTAAMLTPDSNGWIGTVDGAVLGADGTVEQSFHANEGRKRLDEDYIVDGEEHLSVAADAKGSFGIAFDSNVRIVVDDFVEESSLGAKLERFDSSGGTLGSFFLDDYPGRASMADVSSSPGGNTVAAFRSFANYYDSGVWVRATDCHGEPGSMVRMNGETAEGARRPSVAVDERGYGVVVWTEVDPDTDEDVLYGRRFLIEDGCSLCGDANENGRISAIDALIALRASVGSSQCDLERCDTDGSGKTGSGDALRILRRAVSVERRPLRCSAAPIAEKLSSAFLPADEDSRFFPLLVSGDGEAVLAYSQFGGSGGEIFSQTIDETLSVGPVEVQAPGLDNIYRASPSGCVGTNGLATVWTANVWEVGPGFMLDVANVELAIPGASSIRVNSNEIGYQGGPSLACLSDGRYVVSWHSQCVAIDESYQQIRPEECDGEPEDGVYLQVFESDGTKSGPMRKVLAGESTAVTHVAAADLGRFIVTAGPYIEVRSNDGEPINATTIETVPSWTVYDIPAMECVGTHCARINDGYAQLFDADDLQRGPFLFVRDQVVLSADRVLRPFRLAIACEPVGTCLAAWTLEDLVFEPNFDVDLPGVYARPFDVATGHVGEMIRLQL